MLTLKKLFISLLVLASLMTEAQTPAKRNLRPSDVYRLQTISDVQVSPEGNWVSYVLSSVDSVKDKRNSDVWMVSWDGQQSVQLTYSLDGGPPPDGVRMENTCHLSHPVRGKAVRCG